MHDEDNEFIGYRLRVYYYGNRDRFRFYVYSGDENERVEYNDYDTPGSWHHVVGTYQSGAGLNLYVDGLLRDSAPFSGDINATIDDFLDIGDGFVGQADLDTVLAEWGETVVPGVPADPTGDGFVGQADLDTVLADWGMGTPPSPPVPEPGALSLLAIGALAVIRRRRR